MHYLVVQTTLYGKKMFFTVVQPEDATDSVLNDSSAIQG